MFLGHIPKSAKRMSIAMPNNTVVNTDMNYLNIFSRNIYGESVNSLAIRLNDVAGTYFHISVVK